MTLSRIHLGMLGVVSIFTGMISPVVTTSTEEFPFPLTDLQIPAYILLVCLAVVCLLLVLRYRTWLQFFGMLILILLGYLFVMAWSEEVRSSSGMITPSLSWGWIFLAIGSILLIGSLFANDRGFEPPSWSDRLLGLLSAMTILALTSLIIAVSYIPIAERASKNQIIESILGSGSVQTRSWVTMSRPFTSIEKLIFDRKRDALSFFTASGTQLISIPSYWIYDRLPYATTTISDITYTITASGNVMKDTGTVIGKAIIPQLIDRAIVMYSGSDIISLTPSWVNKFTGQYSGIEDIIATKYWYHSIWQSHTGTGYTIYRDGEIIWEQQHEITQLAASWDGGSIMALVSDPDGIRSIMKNGVKIETIWTGYIEGTLRMNGTDSIYAVEKDGAIELIYDWAVIDRKFDEIREIFLDADSGGYVYFGRPLGEQSYCLYTRYRGNLCGLTGYMNPRPSPDGTSIVYAGLKDGNWGIYRNAAPIIRNTGYPNREDISRDYVFFDITNPSYYLFIRWRDDGYSLYKKWAWVPWTWKDVWLDATFGYDNKVIMSVQDNAGWRVIEF